MKPSECPYCGYMAVSSLDEIDHMNDKHPEIIAQRLKDAGFIEDTDGKWVDILSDPNG